MTIKIHRSHDKPHDAARNMAEKVARHLQSEFGISWQWEGDALHFQRSGVNGTLTVLPTEITVEVKLGFLLMALRPKIEHEIHKFLDDAFA